MSVYAGFARTSMLAEMTLSQALLILGQIICLATSFAVIITALRARKSVAPLVQTFFYAFLAALIILLFIAVLCCGWNETPPPWANDAYRF